MKCTVTKFFKDNRIEKITHRLVNHTTYYVEIFDGHNTSNFTATTLESAYKTIDELMGMDKLLGLDGRRKYKIQYRETIDCIIHELEGYEH